MNKLFLAVLIVESAAWFVVAVAGIWRWGVAKPFRDPPPMDRGGRTDMSPLELALIVLAIVLSAAPIVVVLSAAY